VSGLRERLQGEAADLADRLRGGEFGDTERVGMRSRIRRGRAIRTARTACVAVVAVGILGAGGWGLRDLFERPDIANPPEPSASVSPTSSSTPSMTPSPEPSTGPDGRALPGFVTKAVGLPDALPLPDGLLEQTGPGWVLATYAPEYFAAGSSTATTDVITAEVLYLIDPSGTRYQVLELDTATTVHPANTTSIGTRLLSWEPGSTTALVQQDVITRDSQMSGSVPGDPARLDLVTGALSPAFAAPGPDYVYLTSANGRHLWAKSYDAKGTTFDDALVVTDAAGRHNVNVGEIIEQVQVSPEGNLAIAGKRVVDLDTGAIVGTLAGQTASGWCEPVSWWTADSILALCHDRDPLSADTSYLEMNPRLVSFTLSQLATGRGTVVRTLALGDVEPWSLMSTFVADRVVAFAGTALDTGIGPNSDACATGAYLLRDGAIERMPASDLPPEQVSNIFEPRAVGRTVLVEGYGSCAGSMQPSVLTSYDIDTRAMHELLGPPVGDLPTGSWYLRGLTSWVVAR